MACRKTVLDFVWFVRYDGAGQGHRLFGSSGLPRVKFPIPGSLPRREPEEEGARAFLVHASRDTACPAASLACP